MVVVPLHASFANRAVLRAGGHQQAAISAQFACVHFLKKVHKVVLGLEVAGVAERGNEESENQEWGQAHVQVQEVTVFLI